MIKMAKVGKKNKKVFKIVITEKTKDPYGRALEILGSYDPYTKKLEVKADRVKHWISQGAQMTASINNLFVDNKIVDGKKVVNSKPGTPNKRKTEKVEKDSRKSLDSEAVSSERDEKAKEPAEAQTEAKAETPAPTTETETKEVA